MPPHDARGDDGVAAAHAWFERHSGWAPPDDDTVAEWLADGVCRCPDDCLVVPEATCPHGLATWWVILEAQRGDDERRRRGAREARRRR